MCRNSKKLDIFAIFTDAQLTRAYHDNLLKNLIEIYRKTDFSVFFNDFIRCVKRTVAVSEKNPTVDVTLDFIVKFCTSVGESNEVTCPFLVKIFEFLFENHDCYTTAVRFNICRMINRILNNLGTNASLEENICESIIAAMIHRLQDPVAAVRTQAVLAIYRLQDPTDENCKVMKVLIYHLTRDPSAEVRCAIISKIFILKKTLTAILSRIRDVKDVVRKEAYLVFSRLSAQNFSIRQRQTILSSGLLDSSSKVQDCLKETLLPKWLGVCKDNYVDFVWLLNILDEAGSDVAKKCLQIFFKNREKLDLVDYMQGLLEERTIPYDKLTPEQAFVWRILCEHLRNLDHEEESDLLEGVLPELTLFVEYMKGFSSKLSNTPKEGMKVAKNDFIVQQLLEMTKLYDLADEVGRMNLSQFCISLLREPYIHGKTARLLVDRLGWAIPDANERISTVVEVINDLREPFMDAEMADADFTQMRITETEKTQLRERLEELKREQSEAVEAEDYMVAKEVQLELSVIERKLSEFDNSGDTNLGNLENIDPEILEKCLLIINEMVDNKDITKMTPTLRSLLDNFIRPAFQKYVENPAVRTVSLEVMGIFCLLDVELARRQFIIFCFLISSGSIPALKIVFDMLLRYGLRMFNVEEPTDEEEKGRKPARSSSSTQDRLPTDNSNIITLLATLLDAETKEVRSLTADGFCKLFLMGRLRSAKLLASLIAMWFNPKSAEDSEWRQRFGLFLSAFMVTFGAQSVLENAFLPTLQLLFEPPPDSQLAEVDPDSVVQVLVKLTNPDVVTPKPEESVHNRLAVKILDDICKKHSKNEKREKVRVLMRALTLLTIQSNDMDYLNNLIDETERLVNKFNIVGDKTCYRLAVKFCAIVKDVKHYAEANVKSEICNTLEQTHISKVSSKSEQSTKEEKTVESAADVTAMMENESRAEQSESETANDTDGDNDSDNSSVVFQGKAMSDLKESIVIPCSDDEEIDSDQSCSLQSSRQTTDPSQEVPNSQQPSTSLCDKFNRVSQAAASDISESLSLCSSRDGSMSTRSSTSTPSVGTRRSQRRAACRDASDNVKQSSSRANRNATRSVRKTRRN